MEIKTILCGINLLVVNKMEVYMVKFLLEEEGTSMAEYALLVGLLTVAVAVVITTLGSRITTAISKAATAIPN